MRARSERSLSFTAANHTILLHGVYTHAGFSTESLRIARLPNRRRFPHADELFLAHLGRVATLRRHEMETHVRIFDARSGCDAIAKLRTMVDCTVAKRDGRRRMFTCGVEHGSSRACPMERRFLHLGGSSHLTRRTVAGRHCCLEKSEGFAGMGKAGGTSSRRSQVGIRRKDRSRGFIAREPRRPSWGFKRPSTWNGIAHVGPASPRPFSRQRIVGARRRLGAESHRSRWQWYCGSCPAESARLLGTRRAAPIGPNTGSCSQPTKRCSTFAQRHGRTRAINGDKSTSERENYRCIAEAAT